MGQQEAIKKLAAKQEEFQDYLDGSVKKLKERGAPVITKFNEQVANFYKASGWNDMKYFGQGQKEDFSMTDSTNYDIIHQLIQNSVKTILGGGTLEGATVTTAEVEAANAAGSAVALATDPMVAAAVLVISDVMNLFSTSASSTYHDAIASGHVGPGMMLHAYCFSDCIRDKRWFDNAEMRESGIGYALIYSEAQQKVEIEKGVLTTYQNELQEKGAALENMNKQIDDLAEKASTEKDANFVEFKQKMYDKLNNDFEKLQAEVKKLSA